MKRITMKGKNVEEAKMSALEALNEREENVEIRVLKEGRQGVLGMLGGEEAEIEVIIKETMGEEAQRILQDILDKMEFLAVANLDEENEAEVKISVKGEDMGRIIGKEGAMLKALEVVVGSMIRKMFTEVKRVKIDAGGYKEKRERVLEKLADEAADEVGETKQEKILPYLEAADRRIIHTHLTKRENITTHSTGEGKERRLVIAPKG